MSLKEMETDTYLIGIDLELCLYTFEFLWPANHLEVLYCFLLLLSFFPCYIDFWAFEGLPFSSSFKCIASCCVGHQQVTKMVHKWPYNAMWFERKRNWTCVQVWGFYPGLLRLESKELADFLFCKSNDNFECHLRHWLQNF